MRAGSKPDSRCSSPALRVGVGSFAVQLAKHAGAQVTAVCSAAKIPLVLSLGADHALDYATDDFADGSRKFDLILDLAGNPSLRRLRQALTASGTVVIAGGEAGDRLTGGTGRQLRARALSLFIGQRLTSVLCRENAADLQVLVDMVADGSITPSIDRSYPLDRLADAMQLLESGQVRGKVAISVLGG